VYEDTSVPQYANIRQAMRELAVEKV